MRAGVLAIAPVSAGTHSVARELERTGESRERGGVELDADVASRGHLVRVPEQTEPRHVRDRVRAERP